MDCKSFARKHSEFVDDTLPGCEMEAMREHRRTCAVCSRRDLDVRRSLLLARNLPRVEVSAGFAERLRHRLAAEPRLAEQPVPRERRSRAVAAAVVVAAAGLTVLQAIPRRTPVPVRLPAVIASLPPTDEAVRRDESPAWLASMSTALPMWPALLGAEEGSLRFAAMESQRVSEPSRP